VKIAAFCDCPQIVHGQSVDNPQDIKKERTLSTSENIRSFLSVLPEPYCDGKAADKVKRFV